MSFVIDGISACIYLFQVLFFSLFVFFFIYFWLGSRFVLKAEKDGGKDLYACSVTLLQLFGRFHHIRMRLPMALVLCHSQSLIAHNFARHVLWLGV